jgi:hypothetical protein
VVATNAVVLDRRKEILQQADLCADLDAIAAVRPPDWGEDCIFD